MTSKPFVWWCSLILGGSVIYNYASTGLAGAYILSDLGGGFNFDTYLVALFGLRNATGLPLGFTHGGRWGRKNLTFFMIYMYALFSFSLGFAPNFPILCVLRSLQGFCAGSLLILGPCLFAAPKTIEARRGGAIIWSYLFFFEGFTGASIGGVISYFSHWRFIAIIEGGIPLLAGLGVIFCCCQNKYEDENPPFDWLGYIAFVVAVWSFSLFFMLGQYLDWLTSNIMWAFMFTFLISFPLMIISTLKAKMPFINSRLLKNRRIALTVICISVMFGMLYSIVLMLGHWIALFVAYSPLWIAAIMTTLMISAFTIMMINRLIHLSYSLKTLMVGIIFFLIATWYASSFNVEINLGRVIIVHFILGVGAAFFIPSLLYTAYTSVPEDDAFMGLAFFQMTRTYSCGMFLTVLSTVWRRRHTFYHYRLGSELTIFSENLRYAFSWLKNFYFTKEMSLHELEKALDRQSAALGTADCLYLMFFIILALFCMVSLYLLLDKRATENKLPEPA